MSIRLLIGWPISTSDDLSVQLSRDTEMCLLDEFAGRKEMTTIPDLDGHAFHA